MVTELTDPHKTDLWETMLSHRVRDKTKPKWQKLRWVICAASALPDFFQFQVNVGTVSSSKAAELCLEEQSEILTDFFLAFLPFWCPNQDDFCVVLDFIPKEQLSSLVAFQLSRTALIEDFRRLWWLLFTLCFPRNWNMQAGFSVSWHG